MERDALCADCWKELTFIPPTCCPYCSCPDFREEFSTDCICKARKHDYSAVHAVVTYNEVAKNVVLSLKNNKQLYVANFIARLFFHTFKEKFHKIDILCPVAISAQKIRQRGFNQSNEIMKRLNVSNNILMLRDVLVKRRHTKSQGMLERKIRLRNVKGAYRINPKYLRTIRGKRIGIIDDVITTGSTAHECARVLRRAGAKEVRIFLFARA